MKAVVLLLLLVLLPLLTTEARLKGTQRASNRRESRKLKKEDELIVNMNININIVSPTSRPTPKTAEPTYLPTGMPLQNVSDRPSDVLSEGPSSNPSILMSSPPTENQATAVPSVSPSSRVHISAATDAPSATGPANATSETAVALPTFRVDFVSTTSSSNLGATNGNEGGRNLRFFSTTQDVEIISLLSAHLMKLPEIVGVELDVLDKSESVFGQLRGADDSDRYLRPEVALIIVSYTFSGMALTTSNVTSEKLEELTIRSFTQMPSKEELLASLSSSTDGIVKSITDVDATTLLPSEININEITSAGSDTAEPFKTAESKVNILFPTLIGVAFFSTLSVLGYLTHKKYREYHRNNANNSYLVYQQRKRGILVDTRYNPFESPNNSETENESPMSRDCTAGNFSSQDWVIDDSYEDDRGWSSTSTSTDVLDWEQSTTKQHPYDDVTTTELRMIQMGISMKVERNAVEESQDEATLDGLYSTAGDSYFDGTATQNRRKDSFDTCSVDQSRLVFGEGWEKEVDFQRIGVAIRNENAKDPAVDDVSKLELLTDVTKLLLESAQDDDVSQDEVNDSASTDNITSIIVENNLIVDATRHNDAQVSPDSSDTSEDLCATISKLDEMIHHNQAYKKSQPAPCSPETPHSMTPQNYQSIYDDSNLTTLTKTNISAGIFTAETLGMINRNRLKATPPPSENDYDEDMVKDATSSSLLGDALTVDSEEEEDLFEDLEAKEETCR